MKKIILFLFFVIANISNAQSITIDIPCEDNPVEGTYDPVGLFNGKPKYVKGVDCRQFNGDSAGCAAANQSGYTIYWDLGNVWAIESLTTNPCLYVGGYCFPTNVDRHSKSLLKSNEIIAENLLDTPIPPCNNWTFYNNIPACTPIINGSCEAELGNQSFTIKGLSVYPNPFTNVFTISLEENATATIFDIVGKQIGNQKLSSGNNIIDLSNSASGMYLVKLSTDNGSKILKMVKQ